MGIKGPVHGRVPHRGGCLLLRNLGVGEVADHKDQAEAAEDEHHDHARVDVVVRVGVRRGRLEVKGEDVLRDHGEDGPRGGGVGQRAGWRRAGSVARPPRVVLPGPPRRQVGNREDEVDRPLLDPAMGVWAGGRVSE